MKKKRYNKPQLLKELENAIFLKKVDRYPSIEPELLALPKYRDDTANGLTKCIIDFLKLKGAQAERISNTGRMIDRRRTYTDAVGITRTIGTVDWIRGSGTDGTADISATIQGKSVKIEIKIGADRQSEAQKTYQKSVEQAGGLYVIAKDFTTFVNWYKSKFGL